MTVGSSKDLSISNITGAAHSGSYKLIVLYDGKTHISNEIQVTISPPPASKTAPVITEHPQNFSGNVGANFELSANASGAPTPVIEWQKKNTSTGVFASTGKTGVKLTFLSAKSEDSGVYRARAHNVAGEAFTNEATVTVTEIKYSFVTQVVTGNQGYHRGGVANVPSKATCPAGWALVGGGYQWTGNYSCDARFRFVIENRPDSSTGSWNTWLAALECSYFQAYAICAQLQPVGGGQALVPEVRVVDGSLSQAPSSDGISSSEATCPAGFLLSGGGHIYVAGDTEWRMMWASQPTTNSSGTWRTESLDFNQKAVAVCVGLPATVKAQNLTRTVASGGIGYSDPYGSEQVKSIATCQTGYSLTGAGHDTGPKAAYGCSSSPLGFTQTQLRFSKWTIPRTSNHSVEVVKDCVEYSAKAICMAVVDK